MSGAWRYSPEVTLSNYFRAQGIKAGLANQERMKAEEERRPIAERRRVTRAEFNARVKVFLREEEKYLKYRQYRPELRKDIAQLDEWRSRLKGAQPLSFYVNRMFPQGALLPEPEAPPPEPVCPVILVLRPGEREYDVQRHGAARRGIAWEFIYETWWSWWQIDDRWSKRGSGPDDLVMCRIGDVGPYAPDNVYCATHSQNIRDAHRFRRERR